MISLQGMFPVLLLCRHSVHWPFFHSWPQSMQVPAAGPSHLLSLHDWDSFPGWLLPVSQDSAQEHPLQEDFTHVLVRITAEAHFRPWLSVPLPCFAFFWTLSSLQHLINVFPHFFKKQTSIFYLSISLMWEGLFCLDHYLYLQGIFGTPVKWMNEGR